MMGYRIHSLGLITSKATVTAHAITIEGNDNGKARSVFKIVMPKEDQTIKKNDGDLLVSRLIFYSAMVRRCGIEQH